MRTLPFALYNQEREDQVKAAEAVFAERDTLAETLAAREAQIERLLTDPAFLEAVQAAYAEETSPEKEVARAKAEVTSLREQQQLEKITEQGQHFYATEITPALDLLVQAFPTVPESELVEKFTMAMAAHVEEGPGGARYIPPSRYEAVRKYIVEDLAVWAGAIHQRRAATDPARKAAPAKPVTPDAQAVQALDAARADAQKAKRQVGQLTKPVGAAGSTGARDTGRPATPAPTTVDDAVSSALQTALASFR